MKAILTLAAMYTRRTLRDKTALFFIFLFPVIFLLVFGFIFRNNNGARFDVAVFNHSNTASATQFMDVAKKASTLKIKDVANEDKARELLSRGELDAYIILPESFGQVDAQGQPSGQLEVRYSKSNEQTASALGAFLGAVTSGINQQVAPYVAPFTVSLQPQEIVKLSQLDYLLSGMIGFSLMSLGIFGVVNGFVGDKKTGAVGRLRVTPLKAWQLIVASGINRILVGLMSIAFMLIVAMLAFGFRMHGNWPSFIIVVMMGAICLFGIGLTVGGWAKSEEQAAPLANLITFPMMFLSGVFFPTFLMPQWLQNISKFIPLTPIIDSLRQIITEGRTVFQLGPQLLVVLAWTLVGYFVAGKVFRWE